METPLNQTQSTTPTSNPQGAASANGASNAADFQKTASPEELARETESLEVQQTGDPLQGTMSAIADNGFSTLIVLGVIATVVIGGWLLYKLMKEAIEEDLEPAPKAASIKKPAAAKKSPAKKKPAPKKTAKKSPAKKTTRKKR